MTNTDKFNPFEAGTSTYDVYSNPANPGNYYEGGMPHNYAASTGNPYIAPIPTMQTMPLQMLQTPSLPGPNMLPGTFIQAPIESITPMGPMNQAAGASAAAGGGMFSGFKNMSAAQQMQMAGGIGGILQGLVGRKARRARQREAKKEYERQRELYQQLDTSNLAGGFRNVFQNMENPYEDLTVNQQQAEFMAQQSRQSQANIMQGLRGAAGASGIAGLAQIIANQSQLAAQKASVSIGLQESQNEKLAAQGAAAIQSAERQGEYQAQVQRLQGARESRALDWQKQEMELGFAMQEKAAADQAVQAANAALWGGIGQLGTMALTGGFGGGAPVGPA